jgi:hypothetical protein
MERGTPDPESGCEIGVLVCSSLTDVADSLESLIPVLYVGIFSG